MAESMILLGADINQITTNGQTALIIAGHQDDEVRCDKVIHRILPTDNISTCQTAVRFLLQSGAYVHISGTNKRAALHTIADRGSFRALTALMAFVANNQSSQLRLDHVITYFSTAMSCVHQRLIN